MARTCCIGSCLLLALLSLAGCATYHDPPLEDAVAWLRAERVRLISQNNAMIALLDAERAETARLRERLGEGKTR